MQKWEYLRVRGGREASSNIIGTTFTGRDIAVKANGVSLARKEKTLLGEREIYPDFDEYINQLGEEGWEMVNASLIEVGGLMVTFKRSKP